MTAVRRICVWVSAAPLAAALSTTGLAAPHIDPQYGRLPIGFEMNRGQTSREVEFLSRGADHTLFLTRGDAVLALHGTPQHAGAAVRMRWVGGTAASGPLAGLDPRPGRTNYFLGSDPARWLRNVPTYGRVRQRTPWPGIDAVYYGRDGELEFDLVVAPGADPRGVEMEFDGADGIHHAPDGALVLTTACGEVQLRAPDAYQEDAGTRRRIASGYVLRGRNRVGFELASYDRAAALVVDPVLEYSTYLGGSGLDRPAGIAVDAAGSAYVTGVTRSADFPTANALRPARAGSSDYFVCKLSPGGNAIVYATYLGGSGDDSGLRGGIAVDAAGNAYVAGATSSTDFPVTAGALSTTAGGQGDAFLAKLDATGSTLLYSTYLGGSGSDEAIDMTADGSGNAYVTGMTTSPNFPIRNAFQSTIGLDWDIFVSKINTTGAGLVYSTYVGGNWFDWGTSIAVDAAGNAYVTGQTGSTNFPTTAGGFRRTISGTTDAYVIKLAATGSSLAYGTYLGGGTGREEDLGTDVAVDASGNAYVTGSTESADFPLVNPLNSGFDGSSAFVTKLSPTGGSLVFSSFLGSPGYSACSGKDVGTGIALDASGRIFVTGFTRACDFPTADPIQCGIAGREDAFVSVLDPGATRFVFSTFLGGSGSEEEGFFNPAFEGGEIALDPAGNAYLAGFTESVDFPVTSAAQPVAGGSSDVFVSKIAIGAGGPATCDLDLTQRDSGDPVTQGIPVIYSLSLRNLGPSCTGGVVVRDRIPAGTFLINASSSRGFCTDSSGTIVCPVGALSPNDSVAFTITLVPSVVGTIENRAWVASPTSDPNPANNSTSELTTVVAPRTADIFAHQSHKPDPAAIDMPLAFEFHVGNRGPDSASAVVATVQLYGWPYRLVSVTTTRGTCFRGPYGDLQCSFGSLAPGDSARVQVRVIPEAMVSGDSVPPPPRPRSLPGALDHRVPIRPQPQAVPGEVGRLFAAVYAISQEVDPTFDNYVQDAVSLLPSPRQLVSDLIAAVDSCGLRRGQKEHLVDELEEALEALPAAHDSTAADDEGDDDDDRVDRACSALADFRRQVRAFAGHGLTSERAQDLDARAAQIQTILECRPRKRDHERDRDIARLDAAAFSLRLTPSPGEGARADLALPASAHVRLDVFDLSGRRVRTAFDGELPAGTHEMRWDGRSAGGRRAPAGVYFLRATAGRDVAVARTVMLR
jgi:uncharacterized repeat protein (TIGR01451 family)